MRLAERLKALEENQNSWRKKVPKENAFENLKKPLESRRFELSNSSEEWRKRVKHNDNLDSNSNPKNVTPIHFRDSNSIILQKRNCFSESTSKKHSVRFAENILDEDLLKKEELVKLNLLTTPRSIIQRPKARRPPSSALRASFLTNNENLKPQNSIKSSSLDHILKSKCQEYSKSLDYESPRTNPASQLALKFGADSFQTPIIGEEHCGVKLRQVETKSPFPEIMLIQAKATLQGLDVRLVASTMEISTGSFLLITQTRLIIFNTNNSTVSERAKVSQMAYEIIAGKEMGCGAAKVEIANDDCLIRTAFFRILTNSIQNLNEIDGENNENLRYSEDVIYWVVGENQMKILTQNQPPSTKILDSEKILIFDFFTEIYIWAGRNADRALIKFAVDKANELKETPIKKSDRYLFGIDLQTTNKRPSWTLIRKLSQGVVDCLFRHKFERWVSEEIMKFSTPNFRKSILNDTSKKRPWSVPAGIMGRSCDVDLQQPREEDDLARELAVFLKASHLKANILQLEGVELRPEDDNLFTEGLEYYRLDDEVLVKMENNLEVFEDNECYVIKWKYRIERKGVRKLDGRRISNTHETGRHRVAFFYWLGTRSNIKKQSRCALALRNFDKEKHEHVRIEQGQEPLIFLHLFDGQMIIKGAESDWFLVIGSSKNLFSAEELYKPITFHSQGAYIHLNRLEKSVELFAGEFCSPNIINGALKLSKKLSSLEAFTHNPSLKNFSAMEENVFKPKDWIQAPRLIRIYETEGRELTSPRFIEGVNFSFRQSDLRDCIFVNQENRLWIWSEYIVPTFALKVAYYIWYGNEASYKELENIKQKENAIVICKGNEPDEFKALFPSWKTFEKDEETENHDPQFLSALLYERTKYRSIDELRLRKLPKGCDTKRLENYLSDLDFELLFHLSRVEYSALPRWRQISMKKEANLF